MGVEYDTVATRQHTGAAVETFSHAITPGGPLAGVIATVFFDRNTVSAVTATWRGASIGAPDVSVANGGVVYPNTWFIPSPGLTNGTFVASWTGAARAGIGLIAVKFANPTNFIRKSQTYSGAGTAATTTLTGVIGTELCIDVLMAEDTISFAPGANQTEIYDFTSNDTFTNQGASSYEAGPGDIIMSQTLSVSKTWAGMAFVCRPPGAQDQVIVAV